MLHCVTSYPVPLDQINLSAMDQMKKYFPGPIGYSDHSKDGSAVATVARGAKVIERHITILKNIPNAQDWKVSSFQKFSKLIKSIRSIEKMIGNKNKDVLPCENNGIKWALKSLFISNLSKEKKILEKDIQAKRPNRNSPLEKNKIIGRKLKKSVLEGDFLILLI